MIQIRSSIICGLVVFLSMIAPAQQTSDRVVPDRNSRQRPSLLDFALKGINSSDRNYGQCIDESRRIVLETTIENGYFWSNLISVSLLGGFLVVMIHQQRVRRRRDLIVAETLAQYHNALARADTQIDEATKRNHALMEALTANTELSAQESIVVAGADASGTKKPVSKKRTAVESGAAPGTATLPAPSQEGSKRDSATKIPGPSSRSGLQHHSEIDLVSKVNLMQQQISLSQEREKQLRRQLNDAELRLQKEQEKNRTLKDT